MKCPKCQFENPEGAKFCNECGAKMELACPACGKVNAPGSKFCNECGHSLKTPSKDLSIDYNRPHSYTPKHLADKILTTRASIEGERKLVTVMFADVAYFSRIGLDQLTLKSSAELVKAILEGGETAPELRDLILNRAATLKRAGNI